MEIPFTNMSREDMYYAVVGSLPTKGDTVLSQIAVILIVTAQIVFLVYMLDMFYFNRRGII